MKLVGAEMEGERILNECSDDHDVNRGKLPAHSCPSERIFRMMIRMSIHVMYTTL